MLSSSLIAESVKWGLKKPSTHIASDLMKPVSKELNNQKISFALSSLTNGGDLSSDYQSGTSIDFLINCNKSCSLLGRELALGFGIGFTPMCNDESDVAKLSMGSIRMHIMPKMNLPIALSFGAGLSHAPGQMGVGMMGILSMDFFYKLPMCSNMSLGVQYKQYVDPEDGELNFSKLSSLGLGLKIDG